MNKLNKFYKAILEALGCKIAEDYSISMVVGDNEYEIKVDGKQLYLPTTEALGTIATGKAFFHPACESITSKETEVIKVVRKLITSSIYFNFRPIADVLFKIANKKVNKALPAKLLEQLSPLRNVSETVMKEVIELVAQISMQTEYEGLDTRILALTVTKGGKTESDEHIYYRCRPSFPFYNELVRVINQNTSLADTPEKKIVFGDKQYSYQAAQCIALIFEIAIPSVLDTTRAEAISTVQTAARLTAILRSFGYIANDINTLICKFRREFDAIGAYGIPTAWIETLEDMPDIASLIQPLTYNNHNTHNKQQDPNQNMKHDPFGVTGINKVNPLSQMFNSNVPSQTQEEITPPETPAGNPGETYIGMTALSNGLFEYRYQTGNMIRVICLNERGSKMTESFTSLNGQAINQQGMYNNPHAYQRGTGYYVQNNGVIVPEPLVIPNYQNNAYYPYNQPVQNNGWGNYDNTQPGFQQQQNMMPYNDFNTQLFN